MLESIFWIFVLTILILFLIRVFIGTFKFLYELAPVLITLAVIIFYYYSTGQLDFIKRDIEKEMNATNNIRPIEYISDGGEKRAKRRPDGIHIINEPRINGLKVGKIRN